MLPVDDATAAMAAATVAVVAAAVTEPAAVEMPYSLFDPVPEAASFAVPQLDFGEAFTTPPGADLTPTHTPANYDPAVESAKAAEGLEPDGGGRLGDAMALIKACLQLDIAHRPTMDEILKCRYLSGVDGWTELAEIRVPAASADA